VSKINNSISAKMNATTSGNPDTIHSLGLLDIFGFESF
jgi:myosin heavy subunit